MSRFPELRAELRQREAHAKAIGVRVRASAGLERMKLWEEKREYGLTTRACLLLLAWLRGKPRTSCEPSHNTEFNWTVSVVIWRESKRFGHEFSPSDARLWLAGKELPAKTTETPDAAAIPSSPV